MNNALESSWIVPIIVAIITGGVSMIVGVINYRSNRRLQEFRSKLDIQKSIHDARQEYEYKARLRLYEEFDPYLFQFIELCESARRAISQLAEWCREERLEELKTYQLKGAKLSKIIYDLFAPMAAFTILRNRLTLFDLSLVPIIKYYYSVAKLIFYMFDEDKQIARVGPAISEYKYLNQPPMRYATDRQGFDIRTIEDAAGALVIKPADPSIRPRVITYNEFADKYQNDDFEPNKLKAFNRIAERLSDFKPESKTVFWRVMIAQARLYQFLENSGKPQFSKYFREPDSKDKEAVFKNMSKIEHDDFDWHKPGKEYSKNDPEPFGVVDKYLRDKLNDLLDNKKSLS